MEGKDLLTSTTFYGALVTLIGIVTGNTDVVTNSGLVADDVVKAVSLIMEGFGLFGIVIGRVTASKKITSVAGVSLPGGKKE